MGMITRTTAPRVCAINTIPSYSCPDKNKKKRKDGWVSINTRYKTITRQDKTRDKTRQDQNEDKRQTSNTKTISQDKTRQDKTVARQDLHCERGSSTAFSASGRSKTRCSVHMQPHMDLLHTCMMSVLPFLLKYRIRTGPLQ